jgi:hypothetical protein
MHHDRGIDAVLVGDELTQVSAVLVAHPTVGADEPEHAAGSE